MFPPCPRRCRARVACWLLIALVVAGCQSATPTSPSPTPPAQQQPQLPPVTNPPPSDLAITCPVGQSATSTGGSPAGVTFATPVTTGGLAPVQVSCTFASGALFPVGSTNVQCTATDAAAQSRSCTFTVTVAPPPPMLTRTTFLAFGDSMTAGEVPVSTSATFRGGPNFRLVVMPTAAYPTQLLGSLRARYTAQGGAITVTNSGVPGETAQDGLLRLPNLLANQRPQVVLIFEGINDIAGEGTLGVGRAMRAVDAMAKEARARGARVFIATMPPGRAGGTHTVSSTLIDALNSNLRDVARGEGAVLVDLFQALSGDIPRFISFDGLHPTEAGYQRIAQAFFDAIRQDLESR